MNDPGVMAADQQQRKRAADLGRALTVARWTDARFIDPLLGLVLPGAGDVLGAAAGLYIVVVAVRHNAPRTVVTRMLFNLAIDCLGGVVPVVGDLFDALNRANVRNARLLEKHLAEVPPNGASPARGKSLVLPVAALVAAMAAALAVTYLAIRHWWPAAR